MINLYPIQLQKTESTVIISAPFESNGRKNILWYSVPVHLEKYIVTEQLDAFLVGIIFLGLRTGQDISVHGAVSATLLYSLDHYIIDALCYGNSDYKRIVITADSKSHVDLNVAKTAGTGLSCGVDSFTTYFEHYGDEPPYEIDYFTFFNVGSHGDFGGDQSRDLFYKRLKNIKDFGALEKKEVIVVDSNLSEILEMKFPQTYNLRTISCVLLLQKLFRNYYYSSGTRWDHFGFNNNEIADLDMLIIPNLSTESTSMFVSGLRYSRIERTELISNYPQTYRHLDVCTLPYTAQKLNCSSCYKCQRTMLTLDLLGKLDNYNEVFDIQNFRENKSKYIGWLLAKDKKLTLDKELITFLRKERAISFKSSFFNLKYRIYNQRKKINKKLKG